MGELDPSVLSYSHLRQLPREKEALHALKKIASLVKPIMRARGWEVGQLAEFFPDQANLLGLNVNRGQKILLRLRYAGDKSQFLPMEQVTDTMLHELSHIVHGPHNQHFNALWNQLRDEYEGLVMKGYTGEGFLSDGRRLGGRSVPKHEARRLARAAAERRRGQGGGSGHRLGGAAALPGQDIRRVIANAVEQRNATSRGCGNTNHSEREIHEISETAKRNGFRTQAEEDAANEVAIAQALWELVQEDEQRKYGDSYIPPSAEHPAGNGGWSELSQQGSSSSTAPEPDGYASAPPDPGSPVPPPTETRPPSAEPAHGWSCPMCTLHNPANYLCCDACGTERSPDVSRKLAERSSGLPRIRADQTKPSRAAPNHGSAADSALNSMPQPPATWMCSFCGTSMERQWWTCSMCGKMKDSSE